MKEYIELSISAIAILISIIVGVCDFRLNFKLNKINMESEIYQNIFFEHFIHKIQQAQHNIRNTQEGLTGTDALEEELNNLRHEALFFLYKDELFYKKLCGKLQKLEDNVINANNIRMNDEEYSLFFDRLKENIKEIYSLVMNKYEGLRC